LLTSLLTTVLSAAALFATLARLLIRLLTLLVILLAATLLLTALLVLLIGHDYSLVFDAKDDAPFGPNVPKLRHFRLLMHRRWIIRCLFCRRSHYALHFRAHARDIDGRAQKKLGLLNNSG
jgi:hypothetical protein